jgi:hypothetical protein
LRALNGIEASLAEKVAKFGEQAVGAKYQEILAQTQQKKADSQMALEQLMQDKSKTVINSVTKVIDTNAVTKEQLDTAKDLRTEYNTQTKDYKADRDIAAKITDHLPGAKKGNPESINALNYLVARYFSGPGVLTDNDLKNASVNRSVFNDIGSKISKGLTGDLTDSELSALGRLSKVIHNVASKHIARVSKDYITLSRNSGVPDKLVVISPDDRGDQKKSVTSSMTERK